MRFLLALLLLSTAAHAQEQPQQFCLPHDEMKAHLAQKYKEGSISIGVMPGRTPDQNMLMEFYGSQAGSWSIVFTPLLTGRSCIAFYGNGLKSKMLQREQGA